MSKDSLVDFDDDLTPISSTNSYEQLLLKIGVMVEKQGVHVREIPKIQQTLTAVATKQEMMQAIQADANDRLKKIEKNGHPCVQSTAIATLQEESKEWRRDKEEGIKTRGMVTSITGDIEGIDKAIEGVEKDRKVLWRSIVFAATAIIGTLITASYGLGQDVEGLSRRIEAEQSLRSEQYTTLKGRLDALPTKADTPTRAQVVQIQKALEIPSHCDQLTDEQRSRINREVATGHLPPPFSCP